MYVCPYCEWPFALKSELATHIQIKHKGALANLLEQVQKDAKSSDFDESLDDDGVYIGDTVVHAPTDDNDPEQNVINEYYKRLEQKEWDKWELRGYWNA